MNGPRVIKRTLTIEPQFHQIDMLGVAHNAEYFRWFEEGRLRILNEIMPYEESVALGVALPVVSNTCVYRRPVRYGDTLVLQTMHRVADPYPGSLTFEHVLTNKKTKEEAASGTTVVTIVNVRTDTLVREWPAHVRQRYLALLNRKS